MPEKLPKVSPRKSSVVAPMRPAPWMPLLTKTVPLTVTLFSPAAVVTLGVVI